MTTSLLLALVLGSPPAPSLPRFAVGRVDSFSGTVSLFSHAKPVHPITKADINKLIVYQGDGIRASKGGQVTIKQFNGLNSTYRSSLGELILRVANAEEMVLQMKLRKGTVLAKSSSAVSWPADAPIIPKYFEVVSNQTSAAQVKVEQKGQVLWSGQLKPDASGAITDDKLCLALAQASRVDVLTLTVGNAHTDFHSISADRENEFEAAVKATTGGVDPYAKLLKQAAVLVEFRQIPVARRRMRALGI